MTMAPPLRLLEPVLVLLLVAPWLPGCGAEISAPLHGKVTLDGQPVLAGNIIFLPTGPGRKAAGAIEQGTYTLDAADKLAPGAYRVQISWPKPTGRKIPSADPGIETDETREAIPAKYNTDSTLTVEIGRGETEKDFALTSN